MNCDKILTPNASFRIHKAQTDNLKLMVMTDSVTGSKKSEHSIKLPYLYKEGSKILQAYAQKKGTLKSLVYATRQERVST